MGMISRGAVLHYKSDAADSDATISDWPFPNGSSAALPDAGRYRAIDGSASTAAASQVRRRHASSAALSANTLQLRVREWHIRDPRVIPIG